MELIPDLRGEEALQVDLGLSDVFSGAESPALRQPVDVRVDGKSGNAEGLREHHAGGLVADARKRLQFLQCLRNFSPMPFKEQTGQAVESFRFLRSETTRLDERLDFGNAELRQFCGGGRAIKQSRSDQVDPLVGRLRREQHRDEQGERITMVQGHSGLWIQGLKPLCDDLGSFFA